MASPGDRLRPFRAASWAVYLFAAVGFSSLVIYSVTASVFAMSPGKPRRAGAISAEQCVTELSTLLADLERERTALTAGAASEADRRWLRVRAPWVVRLRQLEANCAEHAQLAAAFAQLDQVMDLATVEATQLAAQMGPALDRLRSTLAGLRTP